MDVVVVGGGIAGLSAAWRLAADCRVVLVEREPQVATQTTGRSAAMLNLTSGTAVVCRLAEAAGAFLADPPPGFCDHPLLAPRGLLWVGGQADSVRLDELVETRPTVCTRAELAAARTLVPTLVAEHCGGGAAYEPDAAVIDVAALVDGYRRSLLARGGRIVVAAELVSARWTGRGWSVSSGEHVLTATTLVNAAGPWADEVAHRCGVEPLGLRPLRRTAALVPAPAHTAAWPMVMDVGGRWYANPEAGGLLVSPMDETPSEPCDPRPEEADVALAIERVNAALGLDIRSVRRAWAGLRTFTIDRNPVAGPDPAHPNFVWLAGQGGSGVKTAPALADIVADAIIFRAAVPPAVDPARLRSPDR